MAIRRIPSLLILLLTGFSSSAAVAQLSERQARLLTYNCAQCHSRPETRAPLTGDPGQWQARVAQGEAVLLRHTLEGFNDMPPLGYCSACSGDDFRAIIRAMAAIDSPRKVRQ